MVFKKQSDFNFSAASYDAQALMTVNDLHCMFNMPKAIKAQKKYEIRLTLLNEEKEWVKESGYKRKFLSEDDAEKVAEELRSLPQYKEVEVVQTEEETHGLPPYAPRKAFKVDEYHCPTSWMHGSGLASSYFVPIEADHGMWLDFNRNSDHKHHVAILISVQGVNPLDGQSMVEGALSLKQYKTKCPVHDVEFGGDRYCPKCGYKWVPQNYLCTTGTPNGSLWLDGFLAADGVVRQYYFTEEEAKGVAHQIIGAEKKVYSIGIAFYLSKNPKPAPPAPAYLSFAGSLMDFDSGEEAVKSFDIAAGAKINQKVYADPESLDFWQEKPAGMLYINYTPTERAIAILKKGRKDLTKGGEGFLAGLQTGK